MGKGRLTDIEIAEIESWPRPQSDLGRLVEDRMRRAVTEIRERRAADLDAEGVAAIRTARDEMARFDFLPEIPRLIAALDRVLAAQVDS